MFHDDQVRQSARGAGIDIVTTGAAVDIGDLADAGLDAAEVEVCSSTTSTGTRRRARSGASCPCETPEHTR